MDTTTLALIELGAVFFGLGVLGRLAARIGMSPLPFYLIGGLCFGNGGFIQLGDIGAFSHIASEIGVVLLLLLLGLEYTANELISGLRRSRMAGLLDLALNAVPGAAVALILGLGPIGAFVLAGVTYISSSGIVAKVLADLGRLGNRETPVVLSILVFEDLAMAVYLPILTAILAGVSLLGGLEAVAISLGLVTVVLVLVVRYGRYVSVVLDSPDRKRCCSSCSARHCWWREWRRPYRCPRPWVPSCWASPSPVRRHTTRSGSSNRSATCSPPSSSSSSDSTPIRRRYRRCSAGRSCWPC